MAVIVKKQNKKQSKAKKTSIGNSINSRPKKGKKKSVGQGK
jgi:hypothetical protein